MIFFRHIAGWLGLMCALLLWVPSLPAAAATGKEYLVQKNDTLYGISQKHGVSVDRLVAANGLKPSAKIYPGQRLFIPGKEARPSLNPTLKRQLDQTRVSPGKWSYIVIHHSATASGSAKNMDRYHREERRMENGLAYHFVIGNGRGMEDGAVAVGHRWTKQIEGGHLASLSLNQKSLGICLVGNFDEEAPTQKQMESLRALVEYLSNRCQIPAKSVKTHQQINTRHTRCPGRHFPATRFLQTLK